MNLNIDTYDDINEDSFLHDLAIPLTALKLNLDMIKDRFNFNNDFNKYINRALLGYQQIDNMISYKRIFNNKVLNVKNSKELILIDEIDICLEVFKGILIKERISVDKIIRTNENIYGSSMLLRRIICNILKNSVESLNKNGGYRNITIAVFKICNRIHLKIKDNGNGFPVSIMSTLNENKYINSNYKGKGILNIKRMVKEFKGNVEFGNNFNGGAFVRLSFPIRINKIKN